MLRELNYANQIRIFNDVFGLFGGYTASGPVFVILLLLGQRSTIEAAGSNQRGYMLSLGPFVGLPGFV